MSRLVLWALATLLVGCAQGTSERGGQPQQDSGQPPEDAGVDINPPPTDGPPADLIPPIDQMVTPDACVPAVTELLVNGAFDSVTIGMGWTQQMVEGNIVRSDGVTPDTAPNEAWLGGYESNDLVVKVTDAIYQDVSVPAMTTALQLTGRYIVGTQDNATTAYDTGSLSARQTNGTTIVAIKSLDNTMATGPTWQPIDHSFSQNLSGQAVRIFMTSSNDYFYASNFFFDTLSLRATHGCP